MSARFPLLRVQALVGWVLALLVGWAWPAWAFLINEWEEVQVEVGERKLETAAPTPGKPWSEPLSGMRFNWVEAGCFKMGSPPKTDGRDADEGPVRKVCLPGYWIGETEVTQGQWRRVIRANPSQFPKGDEYPLERVAWDEVEGFVRKLNAHYPGKIQFRLPTEAEWEYACRNGGQSIKYAGGGEPSHLGWFANNSLGSTQPVGRQTPNKLGLKDMSGNVWEWTLDAYATDAYARLPEKSPMMKSESEFRTLRGGGWNSPAQALRCANRGFEYFGTRSAEIGFRLVRVIDTTEEKRGSVREVGF